MDKEPQQEASTLAGWMPTSEWAVAHAGRFFPTKASLDWFIKQHRRELIETDALIPREGRAGSLVSIDRFPKVALAIFKRRALEKDGSPHRVAA
jgi:hypothetical protein